MIGQTPWPIDSGGRPADNSIVNFWPDNRYATVHYDCYRGQDLIMSVALPFIGWALVLQWSANGPDEYITELVPVGLDDQGGPATAYDIGRLHNFEEGQVIQTKIVGADGREVRAQADPGWPDPRPQDGAQ